MSERPAGKRPPGLDRAKDLTTQALHAAMREDWPAAGKAMQAVSDETGGQGIYFALRLLCDTAIGCQRDAGLLAGEDAGVFVPGWLNASTGKLELNADAVPPAHRWAARLVAARAAMDADAYHGLIDGMPEDGDERGAYAAALLTGTALTVRRVTGAGS